VTGRPVLAAGGPGADTPAVGIAVRRGRVLWTAAIPPAVSVVGGVRGQGAGGSGAYGAAVPESDPSAAAANPARFLTLEQVAEELNVSRSQVYALVRDRSLVAGRAGAVHRRAVRGGALQPGSRPRSSGHRLSRLSR